MLGNVSLYVSLNRYQSLTTGMHLTPGVKQPFVAVELALAILSHCAMDSTDEELASDLFSLCGYKMIQEVATIVTHRAELVTSFKVLFSPNCFLNY